GKWGRIVLALNNANTKLFAFYKNGNDAAAASPKPEADLFRADISSGTPTSYTWTNLNNYVQDEPNYNEAGIDPYTTQFNGFNMSLTVKPDNDNILFMGGTVLERVDLSQTIPSLIFHRMGGYGKGFFPNGSNFIYPNHHPDIHGIYFLPGSTNTLITVDDGGVQKTTNGVMADTVVWKSLDSTLQTLQYQFINIYPDTDAFWVIGGAQDNGTLINLNAPDFLEQNQLGSGDGAGAAISRFTKTGTTWKQAMYLTVSQGTLYRSNFIWQFDQANNQLNYQSNTFDKINPTGLDGNGQWLTLITLDPDSTEHLYYNNKNRLFRTTTASTVTQNSWTEMTGVSSTIPSTTDFSSMAVSKRKNGIKYLYFGTNTGRVFRLDNVNIAPANATPIDITPPNMTANSYVAGIAINPRNPDTVMAVVSNYDGGGTTVQNIFWSGNATSATPTWTVLDGALEPVSVQSCAIVVRSIGVEYYVGTSVGLYSTTTLSGNTTPWVQEGSGQMKAAIIRSLVNRQPDNTMVVGTHGDGAFMAQIGDAVDITDNIVTGIPVITNDRNFITSSYPTLSANKIYYTIGNMFTIKKIIVQVISVNGQQVYYNESPYQNGSVDLSLYARGNYILNITSEDGKYRYIQKLIRH
ncbi:MAG: T9SS type A sorting domain-containing protein, partial [Flavisolibacter sp.]